MSHPEITTLEVRKDNWAETREVTASSDHSLQPNEVLFKVDRLALTANNISYAAAGDSLGYWGFFPAEDGWGRIPAMGWGEVIASAHPEVTIGERVWGWFPFSTHLRILAGNVSRHTIQDLSPHRKEYAPIYAQFDRAAANPLYHLDWEDQDSLLRGLFKTSWLVEDFLHLNENFEAQDCLITSASSKTSIALAYCLGKRESLTRVGLTSPRNVEFCKSLGCYDEVLTYDDVAVLDATRKTVLVDMAGSSETITAVHNHYRDHLVHSCRIGATHYEEMGPLADLPGATPQFFFAPSHVQTRIAELGAAELTRQMGAAFAPFLRYSEGWLAVSHSRGGRAVAETYQTVLKGNAPPDKGQIISMWP